MRLALLPEEQFLDVYRAYFLRPMLGLGRVLAVALLLVSVYALLTASWRPRRRALGWFLRARARQRERAAGHGRRPSPPWCG